MLKYNLLFIIVLLLSHFSGQAQSNKLFFDLMSGGGRLYPVTKMKDLAGQVTFFNAGIGLKTSGKKEWQRSFNFPEIGIGLSRNYLTTRSLGNPTAVYSLMNLPLFSASDVQFRLGMNLGITWGFNPYREQYPQYVVIGSKVAVYSKVNLNTSIHILPHIDLLVSAEAYHISNGNTNKPNKGINMLGAEAGLRYTPSNSSVIRNTDPLKPVEKNSSVIVYGAYGWMQQSTSYGSNCSVGTLSSGYYATISHKSRLGAGVDVFYNEGDLYQTQNEHRFMHLLSTGVFGGHELTIDKLFIVTQIGIYVSNPCRTDPFYYERVGLRYIIAGRIIPSITLKVHGLEADFLEWGVGFVLWKKARKKVD